MVLFSQVPQLPWTSWVGWGTWLGLWWPEWEISRVHARVCLAVKSYLQKAKNFAEKVNKSQLQKCANHQNGGKWVSFFSVNLIFLRSPRQGLQLFASMCQIEFNLEFNEAKLWMTKHNKKLLVKVWNRAFLELIDSCNCLDASKW